MKKHHILKRAFAMLIAIVVIASVAVIGASALNGPATNPVWSGTWALWTAPDPSEGEVQGYYLTLYKDHGYIDNYYASYTSYNFSVIMDINGPGWYTFSVAVDYGDAGQSTSVSSAINKYEPQKHVHSMTRIDFSYPTCTEKGCKGYYVCSDCGKWFWDENGDNEITDTDDVFTPALGHDWGEWTVVKKPTTTSEGKAQRVCNNDPDHVQTTEIPKLKSADAEVVLPTEEMKDEETKATETVAATQAPSVMPTTPAPTAETNLLGRIFSDTTALIIAIAVVVGSLLVIAGVIILIVVLKKRKKNNEKENHTQEYHKDQNQ